MFSLFLFVFKKSQSIFWPQNRLLTRIAYPPSPRVPLHPLPRPNSSRQCSTPALPNNESILNSGFDLFIAPSISGLKINDSATWSSSLGTVGSHTRSKGAPPPPSSLFPLSPCSTPQPARLLFSIPLVKMVPATNA